MADDRTYQVVVNHEEQYSIWDSEMDVPAGWSPVGVSGSKADCLAHIERTWTDITPLSVRKKYSVATS
ncbi:MbtH family protein [Kitasatospora sp. NPDC101157]|uniref:MbtH family protein n=1 Tax=Kitasatospora sp. NPDC101157 TaxID=3364098 RepID=UPI0038148C0B